jgi:YD repeat-containing protein
MKAMLPSFKILTVLFWVMLIQAHVKADRLTKPNEPGPWTSIQVNTYTGNLFHQRSDLHIPTLGEIPLDLTFSYNSLQNQQDRGYGNGWSFNFGMWYSISGNTLTVGREEGEEDSYTWNGSVYVPPVGIYDSVNQYLPGKYLLKSKYGIRYYFDDPGHKKLTKIIDRNGNSTLISYTSGKPATVTDPSGRVVNLGWIGDNLSQISDPNTIPPRVINYQYDGMGNLVQVNRPLGNTFQYGYDINGNMIIAIDPRANEIFVAYDENEAVSVINCLPESYSKSFSYDNCNNTTTVSQVVSAVNRQTIYTFDLNGRVTGIQYPDASVVSYSWDSQDNIISFVNESGDSTTYDYDSRGNLLVQSDCRQHENYFTYEATFNKITSNTDKNGNTSVYNYDAFGNGMSFFDVFFNVELRTFDIHGNVTNFTDKLGNTTNFSYNGNGDLTGMTDPLGFSESYTYDNVGNMLTFTDKRGFITTYSYDLLNRRTGMVDPAGNSSSRSYDANGNVVTETNPRSFTTNYSYDALNRKISKTDAVSGVTTMVYDEAGNVVSETNARGCTTTYTYDTRDRMTGLTDPLGFSESYSYDPTGDLLTSTDKNGNTTSYVYDCLGNMITHTYPDTYSESYTYDPYGNTTGFTDKNGNSTTYAYDGLNRLITTNFPLGYSEQTTYDAVGNKISFTDKNGATINYSYDAMGRLISLADPILATESISYDGNGNRTVFTDKNGFSTLYAYDNLNRLVTETDPMGYFESFTYDGNGNKLTKTDKNGNTTAYAYDGLDRRITTTDPMANTETSTYDQVSNLISFTDKNGATTTYIYDCNDQQTSSNDPLGYTEYLGYDPAGHSISYTDKNGHVTSLAYSCCRLQSKTDPIGFMESYGYDANGNKTAETDQNGQTTIYAYDALNRRISSTTPMGHVTTYSYDGNGNLTYKTDANFATTSFSYNNRNDLMMITYPDASTVNYTYDNRGNLLIASNSGGIGDITTYTYDALGRLISKLTNYGSFSKTMSFNYDYNGKCTGIISESGTISYQYDANGRLIQVTDQNGLSTTFGHDANGNQTLVSYPNGVTTYSVYDALGRVTDVLTTDIPPASPVPGNTKPDPAKTLDILLNTDCGVTQILAPVSGPGLTNSEAVTVMLTNFGTQPVFTGKIATYTVDGGPLVSQSVAQPLFPGNSIPFTFSQTADLSIPGHTYLIQSCLNVTGDQDPSNNCTVASVENQQESQPVNQHFHYQYDGVGNMLSEMHEDNSMIMFSYSPRNELLQELKIPSNNLTLFTYTPTSQRASMNINGDMTIYTYNNDDVMTSAGTAIFIPDNKGNRITKTDVDGTTQYLYGYHNELKQVTLPDLTSYHYDYSASGKLIKQNNNGLISYFHKLGTTSIEEYDEDSFMSCYYNPDISITQGSNSGYYHYDGFGSTTLQTDPARVILASAHFDPFGNFNQTGIWMNDRISFLDLAYQRDINLYDNNEGIFADPESGITLDQLEYQDKGKTDVTNPENVNPETVAGNGKKTDEKKKPKCCGVKKFVVTWKERDDATSVGFRIDVTIEFMNDEEHDPACCVYCQNVSTVWEVKDGPNKGKKSDAWKAKMHDDHYSRGDDSDGKPELGDPGFTTDDSPGVLKSWLKDGDDLDYTFTAEQIVKEGCDEPCPKGAVVAQRGPHSGTVTGKATDEGGRKFGGVPATLDK